MTLDSVINELTKLSLRKGSRKGLAARFVLGKGILKKLSVELTGNPESLVDESIINYVSKNPEYIVVTLDRKLRRRLKELGIKTLTWWLSRKRFAEG